MTEVTEAAAAPSLTILYDEDCGVCRATIAQLCRWDRAGRLAPVPLQSADASADPVIRHVAETSSLEEAIHAVDADGGVHVGGDAVLAIVHELPGGRVLDPWRRVAPFRWVIGIGYDLVARHRHELGRALNLEGPACDIPADPPMRVSSRPAA